MSHSKSFENSLDTNPKSVSSLFDLQVYFQPSSFDFVLTSDFPFLESETINKYFKKTWWIKVKTFQCYLHFFKVIANLGMGR